MRISCWRALAAGLVCALGACVTPTVSLRDADLEGWLELHSRHFVLMGDVPRQELERFATDLAVFVAVVEEVTNTTAHSARVPARIYLVDGRVEELLKPGAGLAGYMAARLDGYYCVVGTSAHAPLTRETILHEYTHFLVRKGRALDYPRWYDEGFAEVLSTTRRRAGLVTVGTPAAFRLGPLLAADTIDLEAIFAAQSHSEMEDVDAFYSGAWAVTHFLATTRHGRSRMTKLVDHQSRGMDWREAYDQAFTTPLPALEEAVERHVHSLARGALVTVATFEEASLDVEREWEIRELGPGEVSRALGELALAVFEGERPEIPLAFFEQALKVDPADARAAAGRARSLAWQRRLEEASDVIGAAVEQAPHDVVVQLAAGDVQRARVTAAGSPAASPEARLLARRAYAEAARLDPAAPAAWAGLGWSYVGADDPGPGLEALERARSLGGWDTDVALDLGRLHRRAGDPARARALWTEVTRLGSEEEVEEAERLLAELPAR